MDDNKNETKEWWACVEVMGHQRVVGRVSEVKLAGASFLRVDIPIEGRDPQILAPSSIFRITMCSEEKARAMAKHSSDPMPPWMLGESSRPALPVGYDDDEPIDCDPIEAAIHDANEEGVSF